MVYAAESRNIPNAQNAAVGSTLRFLIDSPRPSVQRLISSARFALMNSCSALSDPRGSLTDLTANHQMMGDDCFPPTPGGSSPCQPFEPWTQVTVESQRFGLGELCQILDQRITLGVCVVGGHLGVRGEILTA